MLEHRSIIVCKHGIQAVTRDETEQPSGQSVGAGKSQPHTYL